MLEDSSPNYTIDLDDVNRVLCISITIISIVINHSFKEDED
jgi:hypothetical protein